MAAATTTSMCKDNCTNAGILYEFATDDIWSQWNALAYYLDYQPWIFSLIGSAMVGLSGVLPLLVIPIDEGADLKNGAGAGTLKILLSFAVGGLLGDVFLHLLPEAWASKALNIAQADGQRPMACGLWVLTGFLVFIIAEKIFIGEGDDHEATYEHEESNTNENEKTHEFFDNNAHKELENNNCLPLNGSVSLMNLFSKLKYTKDAEVMESPMGIKSLLNEKKNGYTIEKISMNSRKHCFMKNSSRIKDSNGFKIPRFTTETLRDADYSEKSHRANDFVGDTSSFDNDSRFSRVKNTTKNQRKNEITKSKIMTTAKPKGKHITGYLNLMANCIDNFTHGLAVGGSFLVSFRLGALTTFAILIHEIPHEVGDFAILLKSGFTRWDAARAQLLTASGGIFGALVAVLCSGSGIESRTSWILPFTAGGFLHIGMVTILPELLKETNPKESMKQLGALLSGITVMALLTILCD